MKNRIISLSLALGFVGIAASVAVSAGQKQTPETSSKTVQSTEKSAPPAAETIAEVVKRGQPLGSSPAVQLADVLKEPQKFADKPVMVEGVIDRVCTRKGCWMELAPKADAGESVRVTFKDYGFFVPLNSQGMKARAEGQFAVKVLSKEKADHYAEEGARLRRNADGSADEISFVASGLELRK